jgi:hypothetical protein
MKARHKLDCQPEALGKGLDGLPGAQGRAAEQGIDSFDPDHVAKS